MRAKYPYNDFIRLATLHNQITYDATRFTEHFQKNIRISSLLSEFFHTKWLLEIVAILRTIDPNHLGIRTHAHRVCSFLGFIELYLSFRGLSLLDSTLVEINASLNVSLTKNDVCT